MDMLGKDFDDVIRQKIQPRMKRKMVFVSVGLVASSLHHVTCLERVSFYCNC